MEHPLVIAHRAMTPNAVENARSSLTTLDGVGADLVVTHDTFLGRTMRERGWVRLWPSLVLKRVPLRNTSECVPLLIHMLASIPPDLDPAAVGRLDG